MVWFAKHHLARDRKRQLGKLGAAGKSQPRTGFEAKYVCLCTGCLNLGLLVSWGQMTRYGT